MSEYNFHALIKKHIKQWGGERERVNNRLEHECLLSRFVRLLVVALDLASFLAKVLSVKKSVFIVLLGSAHSSTMRT